MIGFGNKNSQNTKFRAGRHQLHKNALLFLILALRVKICSANGWRAAPAAIGVVI